MPQGDMPVPEPVSRTVEKPVEISDNGNDVNASGEEPISMEELMLSDPEAYEALMQGSD